MIAIKNEDELFLSILIGCHNWLWKPKCDDGTVGIQCRMMVKDLEGLQ
jgi:hypothetical protein